MGLITLVCAAPGAGKTELTMDLVGKAKCIAFVPSSKNKNKRFNVWSWQWAEKYAQGPAAVRQVLTDQVRLVMMPGQASTVLPYFMTAEWEDWVFVFDDYPQIFVDWADHKAFVMFVAGIRHRDGSIIVTSQSLLGMVPKYVRTCSDVIVQVGPVWGREEARSLYELNTGQFRNFNEFYKQISSSKRYEKFPVRQETLIIPD
jgi:hypothetical protein